jgi:hypothetical protein
MKKLLSIIAVLLILIPCSASAIDLLNDYQLSLVTGQAGLDLFFEEDFIAEISLLEDSYMGLDDGLNVIIKGQNGEIDDFGQFIDKNKVTAIKIFKQDDDAKPLSIDIGDQFLSGSDNSNNTYTTLDIGLPEANIMVTNIPQIDYRMNQGSINSIMPGNMVANIHSGAIQVQLY